MAKPKQQGAVASRPLYSRISYLYQAAAYLSSTASNETSKTPELAHDDGSPSQPELPASMAKPLEHKVKHSMSRHLLSDMRATSLKSQIRLSPAMKQTICKYCDTLLIDGETSTSVIENTSKGSKKPWADVLVMTCKTCGGLKRFPVNATRPKRRPAREQANAAV